MLFSKVLLTCFLHLQVALCHGDLSTTPQDATSFSLVYGYPLLSWAKFVGPLYDGLGTNTFYHSKYFVSANSPTAKDIVAPNQDTLYSAMVIDLTKENLNITLPEISTDWFHLFSFYDPFGDNWANLGSQNLFGQPGSYLLRRSLDPGYYGIHADRSGQYVAYLDAPQSLGVLLVRWLIFNESSYDQVHEWQANTTATSVPLLEEQQIKGGVGAALAAAKNASSPAAAVMGMLAEINSYCPPLIHSDQKHVNSELEAAGIVDGVYRKPAGVDLAVANSTVPVISKAELEAPGNLIDVGNGWNVIAKNASGTYGTHYGIREAVAGPYYLQITEPNAYYPTFDNGSTSGTRISTDFTLEADEAYVYTFSGRPPISETGFWSLTLYQDQYLVSNPLDRSSLGDRSNLTFPDGRLVYHDGGVPTTTADGEFQILIQRADAPPPANWTSNWLPGPAGGGRNVSVLLRWYDAYESVTNGSYVYPTVTKQPLISNSTTGTATPSTMTSSSPGLTPPVSSLSSISSKLSGCSKL